MTNPENMTKNDNVKNNNERQRKGRLQQLSTSIGHYHYHYFIGAAIATGIAGIVHLLMPLYFVPPMLQHFTAHPLNPIFFLGSGIAQLFWVVPMIKRWGKAWYYIGIVGNIGFIILYVITRLPGNPVTGRGGDVDIVDVTCELAQVAYIIITAIILVKERSIKVVNREQLR